MCPQTRRFAVLAAACGAAALGAPAPAQAADVIHVQGDRAELRSDPFVPNGVEGDLGPPPGRPVRVPRAGASSRRGERAVGRALGRAVRARRISRSRYSRYRRIFRRALSVRRRLRGARRRQLSYVIASVEGMALRRRLVSARMPVVFLTLERNTQYWRSRPYPGSGQGVTFGRSEVLFEYYPGRGLQLQPLSTFRKANRLHGACSGTLELPCSTRRLRRLLDEMSRLAVRRSRRFIAWEYLFHFGGGSPPWMSGMAQATGIQALARASRLLRQPRYARTARRALGAFSTPAPVGVRARGFRGGRHYLQYSFARRLFIFNAFTQSVLGLYDYAQLTGDRRARRMFQIGEAELRREIPASDVGDWSRYSYRGRESTGEYHELLREVVTSMCTRRLGDLYCRYARRYRSDQRDPAVLRFRGPSTASSGQLTRVVFGVSKLSVVELRVYKGSSLAFRRVATFRKGRRSFLWRPRSSGLYTVRLGAKELRTGRGLRSRASGEVQVD